MLKVILAFIQIVLPILVLRAQSPNTVDSLTKILEQNITNNKKVAIYLQIADVYAAYDSVKTVEYAQLAFDLSDQIGYPEGKVDAYYLQAAVTMSMGHAIIAAGHFKHVVDEARKIDYKAGEAKGLNGLGATRDFQGDYAGALDYLFQALKINEELGDRESAASRYNNIGLVYASQEDYPNAIKYFIRALDVYDELNNYSSVALVSANIGEQYMKQKKLQRALEYFERALVIYTDLQEEFGIANTHRNLADTYREQGNIANAISNYQRALEITDRTGGQQFRAQILIGMGISYMKLEQWRQAKQHLEEGLRLSEELWHVLSIRDGWQHLALVEEQLGNFGAALTAQKKFKQAADSILNTEQTKRLTLLEADYRFQQEKDSITFEQRRVTLDFEQEIERQHWIKMTAFAIAIFLGIIALISYRLYRVKQRKNQELSHKNEIIGLKNNELSSKNIEISELRQSEKKIATEALELKERELTTVTMLAYEKNNILERLEDQLAKLSNKVDQSVLPDLKEIKRTIQANLTDDTWSSFTYHFEQVHPEFFEKLKKEYPNLTQNDLKLCAYIKVGLDNKVIARINSVSPDSVKKSLNRLKKKMGLDINEGIRDYLRSYAQ